MRRISRIPKDSQPGERGNRLLQQLDVLGAHLGDHAGGAGEVRAGPGEAIHHATRDRISHRYEDNRNGSGRLLCRQCGLRGERYDHVDLKPHELRGQFGQLVKLAFRPSKLEGDILALDVAELPKAVAQRLERCRRIGPQDADARGPRLLLRARHARPKKRRHSRAGEEREKRAPLHARPLCQHAIMPQPYICMAFAYR